MKLYNTMTKMKEEFIPIEESKVRMYACGPTVYNFFHLGNARPFVTFDTLRRYLEFKGYEVLFCQNFTDIDDRIIQRAQEEGISIEDLSNRYIEEYFVDADGLGVLRPTFQPRATDAIKEIIEIIKVLFDKGIAYENDDGIYFDVSRHENYGKLSHFKLDELVSGAGERVLKGVGEGKRNPGDFVLWKKKKGNEPSWSSPWGEGRPGWHIECSAMIKKYLGETIDIHGGGQDLIFPHHENEIAQSECASGKMLAKYWIHNAFVNIDNEKMSKSAGNFFMIRDIVDKYSYQTIRFFILLGHYRMPINFSSDLLDAAVSGLERIKTAIQNVAFNTRAVEDDEQDDIDQVKTDELKSATDQAKADFIKAMDDDLNTADAITAIFQLVRAINSALIEPKADVQALQSASTQIISLAGILGIDLSDVASTEDGVPQDVHKLVIARAEAKKNKNFAEADQIREEVLKLGYQINDTPSGPQVVKL